MKKIFFALLAITVIMTSCTEKHQPMLITKKIQYDVNIKSPNPEYDWWIQNLVGPDREKLVDMIIDGAKNGKYKVYNYYYQPISADKVADILSDTLVRKLQHTSPPYEFYDTLIIHRIRNSDIEKIRFMEEWRTNPATMNFEKIIRGICPVARRIDAMGNAHWQPLFWIFFDKKFVKQLQDEAESEKR